ncbi:peptidylprolyl isomerase [Maritimibacter sp. HL-12]|uniref:peptidylprolyl isomerase n=1 Tax=Maritimibacter sp. HL-12 TaxID=1162418 RepID=UPI000A0F1D67|nr:peptidylprolyl isomerase [Maritimibacter sp. HL-12]SMH50418.1 peptidyl-prolyl cis-trans isomerase C [Maritimibacter sp. HL-12]
MNAALFPEVIVNGETVPHTAIAAETQNHSGPKGKPGVAWRKAANAVAVRTLLLQEARRRGLSPDPAEVGPGRFETEEEALIRGLLETAVDAEAPTEEAIHAEWARDPERFRAPPLWEVSHILVACDPRDESLTAEAKLRAEDIARQVQADPKGFGRLAADHSDCGSKASGGALGQIGPGDTVPEFEAALHGLAAGQVTASPVLSRHGWHIIRMDAVGEGAVLPYAAVRGKIAEAMEKAAWAQAARDFVSQLVSTAEIIGTEIGADG